MIAVMKRLDGSRWRSKSCDRTRSAATAPKGDALRTAHRALHCVLLDIGHSTLVISFADLLLAMVPHLIIDLRLAMRWRLRSLVNNHHVPA